MEADVTQFYKTLCQATPCVILIKKVTVCVIALEAHSMCMSFFVKEKKSRYYMLSKFLFSVRWRIIETSRHASQITLGI